ncbi:hypothetical protein OPV22_032738 [Ensete ventricosum]|uniref:Uncharacterized protein n=1 Tax=Ensete ventricosum TaxID=4639 RepID=A0AAV8PNF7_ENSVE|nr:hypothetical protein OPV22_032738 [Ensete ventricosum]
MVTNPAPKLSWGNVNPCGHGDSTIASKVVHENGQTRYCVTHQAHGSVSKDGSRLDMKRATSSAWRILSEAQRSQPPTIVQNMGNWSWEFKFTSQEEKARERLYAAARMLSPCLQSFPSVAAHYLLPFTDLEDFGLSTNLPVAASLFSNTLTSVITELSPVTLYYIYVY